MVVHFMVSIQMMTSVCDAPLVNSLRLNVCIVTVVSLNKVLLLFGDDFNPEWDSVPCFV